MEECNSPSTKHCSTGGCKHDTGRRPLTQLNGIGCMYPSANSCHNSPMISKSRSCHSIQEDIESDGNIFVPQNSKASHALSLNSSKTPLTKGFTSSSHLEGSQSSGIHASSHGRSTPSPLHPSKSFLTPLSSKNFRRFESACTSHSSCASKSRTNPFEDCPEVLQLPSVSPSLFKEVVSPSDKIDENFSWSIDQMALLHPAQIDTSPYQQCPLPQDPEYERRAQDAIDRFFSSTTVVPSPWTSSSSQSLNLMSAFLSSKSTNSLHVSSASPALPPPHIKAIPINECEVSPAPSQSVWCQTELTFPPNLPREVEAFLSKFCNFTQDQTWQLSDERDEMSNLNASSLRRKLLFDAKEFSNGAPSLYNQSKSQSISGANSPERDSQAHSPSSVASVGPLPLDDDESPKIPWGSSMIRSSRKLRHCSHSISSLPSGLSSESNGGLSNSPVGSTSSNCGMLCYADSSPICYLTPKIRMIHSPQSDIQESQIQSISSPDISPIHRSSPVISSVMADREPIKFPAIKASLTPLTTISKFPPSVTSRCGERVKGDLCAFKCPYVEPCQTCLPQNLTSSLNCSPKEIDLSLDPNFINQVSSSAMMEPLQNDDHQHFTSFEMIEQRNCLVQGHDSPSMKLNLSPQFSSSPIRHANRCCEATTRLERSPFDRRREDRTPPPPMRFSNSPPISPIAWKGAPGENSIPTFIQYSDQGHESILIYQNSTELPDKMEGKSCELSRSRWVCSLKDQARLGENKTSPQTDLEKDITMVGFGQGDTHLASTRVPLCITDMDTDSQPFLEGSCLEEASNAHDTGYHTGTSSLQATSHSIQL